MIIFQMNCENLIVLKKENLVIDENINNKKERFIYQDKNKFKKFELSKKTINKVISKLKFNILFHNIILYKIEKNNFLSLLFKK